MQVAAALEAVAEDLRTDLRTTLDVARRPAEDALADDLRQRRASRVARALNNRAEELIPLLPVPSQPWRLRWFVAPVALGALAALVAPALWQAGWQQLWSGPSVLSLESEEDRWVERRFFSAPDVRVEPPSYLRIEPRFLPSMGGGLEVPRGSRVTFQWHMLEPVRAAELILGEDADAERIPLVREGPLTWATSISAMEPATLRLEVRTEEGRPGRDVAQRRLIPIVDEPPVVVLQEPTGTLSVTPDEQVGLNLLVSDDHAISEITVRWAFQHDEEPRWQVRTIATGLRTPTWEGTWALDLRPLRLHPRDELMVIVDAADHDDVSGPNIGSSDPLVLRVEAEDDLNLEVLRIKEALRDALLDRLGDHLPLGFVTHGLHPDGDALVALPARVDEEEAATRVGAAVGVADTWPEALELAAALVDALERDGLSSERETTLWAGTAGQVIARTESYLEALMEAAPLAEAGALDLTLFRRAARAHDAQMQAVERAVLLLGDLIAEQRADVLERSMEELREARERLRELLQEYRDTQDPDLRAAIEAEISRLQRRMQELIAQMREQTEQMPWEHVNTDALDPSEMSEQVNSMSDAFEEMRQRLEEGDIDAALDMLERFGESLDQMLDGADGLSSNMDLDSVSRFDEAVGELMEEITNLAELERAIEEQTQELEESLRQEREQEMREQVERVTEELRERMERTQEALDAVAPESMSETLQRAFDEAQRGFDRLQRDLEEGDVASALEQARLQLSLTSDLEWMSMQQSFRGEGEQLQRQAQRASREVDDASRQLESLMRQSQPRMTPQAEAAAEQLQQDQRQARERVERLRDRMRELEQEIPGIGESLEPELQQVQRAMQEAERGLQQRQMQQALQSEREAIQRLDQARESLQQSMQQERRRQREQGRQLSQERVEIPQDGASDRASFRQRVQEAMRDETVDGYREGIRSYYESLVRD